MASPQRATPAPSAGLRVEVGAESVWRKIAHTPPEHFEIEREEPTREPSEDLEITVTEDPRDISPRNTQLVLRWALENVPFEYFQRKSVVKMVLANNDPRLLRKHGVCDEDAEKILRRAKAELLMEGRRREWQEQFLARIQVPAGPPQGSVSRLRPADCQLWFGKTPHLLCYLFSIDRREAPYSI